MGEMRPKRCEGRELTKDQLAALFSPAAAKPPAASDGGLRLEGVGTLHPIVTVLPCVHAPAPAAQLCGYRQFCFWLCPVLSFVPVATCCAFEAGFRTVALC